VGARGAGKNKYNAHANAMTMPTGATGTPIPPHGYENAGYAPPPPPEALPPMHSRGSIAAAGYSAEPLPIADGDDSHA
jgi:hypothetical protein